MGFFDLFSGSGGDGKFCNQVNFEKNLSKQLLMSPQTVKQLQNYGVTDATILKLEFFFYTNTKEKADSLETALRNRNYEVRSGLAAKDKKVFIVTGWTTKLPMDTDSVVQWTEDMCRTGFEYDCNFDGWGTNPKQ
jgi:phage tail tube protein FII